MTAPLTDGSDREIVAYLRTQGWEDPFPPVPFVVATWERHLGDAVGPQVRSLPHELDGRVGRKALAELSEGATTRVGRQRLFLGTLIWGRGTRNARMLPGMIDALNAPELDRALRDTQRLVHRGLPAVAYDRWVDATIPGLREAFFTKWLWAAGLSAPAGVALRPLVLDSRVWASLRRLGWSSEMTTGRKYRHSPSSAYAAYLATAHRWADWLRDDGLDVSAEDVEQFLFRMVDG